MKTDLSQFDELIIPCTVLVSKIHLLEDKIENLETQRESNSQMNNWSIVKEIKNQMAITSRDRRLLLKILEEAIAV